MKKDQLCTLLITFADPIDPVKQITTAHSFASTDPRHYPQKRRVVHSQQEDEKVDSGAYMTVSRSAHSALGGLGSDMVERGPFQLLKGGGRQIVIQEVRLCYTRTTKESSAPPIDLPRAGPLQIDYITYDHNRDVKQRAAIEEAASYVAKTQDGQVREDSIEAEREAKKKAYEGEPIKITIATGNGTSPPTPAIGAGTKKEIRSPPSKMPAYEKSDGTYEKYREEYSRDMQESRSAYERNFKETMAKKTTYVKQAPSPPQPKQQTSPKPIVVPISREVPINGYGNGYRNKEDIRLYARYDDRTRGQPSPETTIKRPRIIEEYPIKIPVTITTSSPPPPTSPPPRQPQPSREEIRRQETPRGRYSREEAYYLHEEYYRKTKKPVIKPQIIAFGSTYNFAQVQKDQSKEAEVVRQDRSQVIEESRRSQGAPRVIECELRPRPQVVEGPKPRGLPRTPLEEIERIPPGLPRTEIARAEPIDYETYRREVEILQEQQRRAAEIEKREGSPQVSAEPRPIQVEALEPSSEAIRLAEARRQVIEESRPRKIEEYGFDYMETREEVKTSATPKRETRFGVVESPEPTIRASPARVIEEYAEQLTESVLSPEISRSRMTSPESRTSTPSTFPIKSPSIKSPEPVKSPPPRRIEEFSAEILQKYEEFAKQHPPRSKSHERPKEVREAERRARDYPVGKVEETTLEFIKKRDEIKAKSGSTSFPSHARTPYQPPVEGRRPVVTKTKEIIEREFREKVEIVESSRAYKKYGIPLSPASPTGRKVQETRKVFEHEEEIGSSRTSVATPSPRPTVEIPGRVEISEIQTQITETLRKVEQKVKPPPPTPVVVSTKVEEKTTKISEEEVQERLKKLQPLPIKETSEKSTQADEEKPKLTETATQLTPILPESFHIGTQAETPLSISTGTQPEPVKTFEASTQKGHPISLDSTTQFELVESSEVDIQTEPQTPGFELEDITDRQLRELLRREYQIEDIIDIDVVRRQRVKDERELDMIPETVEAEEEVEESREAEIRETPIQLPTIVEPIKLEEEEDESTFEERVDETLTRTMATIEKTRKSTSSTTKKNDSKTNEKSSSFVSSATVTPKTTKTTSPVTATAELKLSHDIDTSHRMDYYTPEYRSTITPRTGHVRSDYRSVSPASTTRMLKVVSETSSISGGGLLSPYGSTAAATIRDAREREKKEMSDLNDRLASYIEKVRFLEAQNRKLAADLDFLRNRWGRDTHSIRDMYESELKQAKKVLHDANKDRDELEKQIKSLHDEIGAYRRKYEEGVRHREADKKTIDELLNKLATLESEVDLLRRRIANLEDDVSATKRENVRLMNDLQRARMDLDQETLNRIDYQNQVQTLLEEVEFLRRAHDQEIRDLQAMASRDTTSENREYFKNELAQAIREIREEYEQLCNVQRNDMESWYKLKVQEIQTQSARQTMEQSYAKDEIKRLRVQLGDLRGKLADLEGRNSLLEKQIEELNYQLEDDQRSYEAALNDRDSQIRKIRDECQALMVELQMLLDTKQTLDAEIAIYRKMLEGEEDRAGLRQLVEQVVRTHQFKETQETDTMRVLKGETASRSSYQRSAKGNVSILEAANDGKYVIIENTHRSKEEDIGEWKLKRRLDSKKDLVFTFPKDFILKPGKSVKIWSRGHGVYNPPDQLVFDAEDTWGTGHNVHTILYNTQGEERATLIQRTSHTTSGH